jgi:hypothetical protein
MNRKNFDRINDKLKIEFLFELLTKQKGILNQFDEYISASDKEIQTEDEKININELLENIKEKKDSFIEELESLNLEDFDWEDYVPSHSGYIPEYEAMEDMAMEELECLFDTWESTILVDVKAGDIVDAFIGFAALYIACHHAEINDPCDTLCDHLETFIEFTDKIKEKIIQHITQAVITNRQVKTVSEMLCKEHNINHEKIPDFINYFEPLLLRLIENKEKAEICFELIICNKIDKHLVPQLILKINKKCNNEQGWIENAETLFLTNTEVAEQLMDHYLDSSENNFIRIAKKVYEHYKGKFLEYLLKNVDEKNNPDFYKSLLYYKTTNNKSIDAYKELRQYLNDDEVNKLLQYFTEADLMKIKILNYEKRHDEILQIVKQNIDSWHLNEIIEPILNVFPEECFNIIKTKCLTKLEKQRGRYVYQGIIDWLKLAKQIRGKESSTNSLIKELYNWKPRLLALKDEMRKAGLV